VVPLRCPRIGSTDLTASRGRSPEAGACRRPRGTVLAVSPWAPLAVVPLSQPQRRVAQVGQRPQKRAVAPTETGATGGAPLGWNFFHAFYCVQFIDTDGNQWTSVFSKETPSQSFFTESIPYWADAFRSACPNGSLVGIHVTNSTNGTFDQVEVYGPGF
jgi:hypothetical protein